MASVISEVRWGKEPTPDKYWFRLGLLKGLNLTSHLHEIYLMIRMREGFWLICIKWGSCFGFLVIENWGANQCFEKYLFAYWKVWLIQTIDWSKQLDWFKHRTRPVSRTIQQTNPPTLRQRERIYWGYLGNGYYKQVRQWWDGNTSSKQVMTFGKYMMRCKKIVLVWSDVWELSTVRALYSTKYVINTVETLQLRICMMS